MRTVRVLIVDDSPSMRAVIRHRLEGDPEIVVLGEAGDPFEAREAIKALSPDVVTLDVNMPGMDGLAFLERLMRLRPTPVVMVSSEVGSGAAAAVEALAIGAFDCVPKPTLGHFDQPFPELESKVKAAARAPIARRSSTAVPPEAAPQREYQPNDRVVGIGASTGGVDALIAVLSAFPRACPPTVITQHMPATFTASFARRLDQICAATVDVARDGAPLRPGHVYVAPGGPAHLEVVGRRTLTCRLTPGEPRSGHRPSVDVLFSSLAALGNRAVGVILTGMGGDGAEGLLAMRRAGAATFGQDEATCLVYGMPRVAAEAGAVERQLPLEAIPAAVLALCGATAGTSR